MKILSNIEICVDPNVTVKIWLLEIVICDANVVHILQEEEQLAISFDSIIHTSAILHLTWTLSIALRLLNVSWI